MAQRKSATEPITDEIANATLVREEETRPKQPNEQEEAVTMSEEMKGKFTLDRSFHQILLLLGLEAYKEAKINQSSEQKQKIDKELQQDLSTISIIKEHIKAGEF